MEENKTVEMVEELVVEDEMTFDEFSKEADKFGNELFIKAAVGVVVVGVGVIAYKKLKPKVAEKINEMKEKKAEKRESKKVNVEVEPDEVLSKEEYEKEKAQKENA